MKPLKRFTQCGSITMLFAIFIVLFGVSSTALTTFGKANQAPPATQAPIATGRECSSHEDCASLQYTSCVQPLNDEKTRCLCGDYNAPINGQCSTTTKGVHHLCKSDQDCEEGMICTQINANSNNNNNKTSPLSTKYFSSAQKQKECVCDAANGYQESYNVCNGSKGSFIGIFEIFLNISIYLVVHHTMFPVCFKL